MSELPGKKDLKNNEEAPDINYWRSFEELNNDPEIIEARKHEFKDGVTEDFAPDDMSKVSRRKFLALLGASAALAGTACSDYRDKGEIIPYNDKPEEITVGKPNFYASTCTSCAHSCGILIKTREGRPIKIDGNPDHPVNKGKTCAKGQASILDLYNPERIREPFIRRNRLVTSVSWERANEDIINTLKKAGDKEIALVSHTITSPTTKKLLDEFKQKYPSAKIYSYELFDESTRLSSWKKLNGSGSFPQIKWNEAEIILSLEGDFLGTDGNRIENSRLFSNGRDIMKNTFNRLYVVEGNMSLTGMNSDYRLRLRPDAQYQFVKALSEAVSGSSSSLKSFAGKYNLSVGILNNLVKDLRNKSGKAIVYAGSSLPEYVHTEVNKLNSTIGADELYNKNSQVTPQVALTNIKELEQLVNKINSGNVEAVIHFDSNPVFHFPDDLGYKEALEKVELSVSLTETNNETSAVSQYVIPINHNYEAWGDANVRAGIYSLQQPVISTLYNTRQKETVLLHWMDADKNKLDDKVYHEYLKKNWLENISSKVSGGSNSEKFWYSALHDGVVLTNESSVELNDETLEISDSSPKVSDPKGITVVLRNSYFVGDGRFADNGFLQELPHPVSKITWDNYAAVSKTTAEKLNVNSDDIINIKVGNRSLEIPVFIQPGCADDVVYIELGYGRNVAGVVGTGVGFNAGKLMSKNYDHSPFIYQNADVSKGSGSYDLVSTQDHHAFDIEREQDIHFKRNIIFEGTVEEYKQNPDFLHESKHELESIYESYEYKGIKWGMVIDLNKCTGCSECIVACNVENNIPVVGKDQVDNGREMHWLRVDRYYSGTADDPKVSTQLMLCQHCDLAPCENVCPVAATTHSPDGLNQMVYNRCVGTRYCSNNCPYKVRRFNFFNFRDHFADGYQESDVLSLMRNPEVTVRSRGVMEKCTFCIQRIMDARSDAIAENREIKGNDVTTACQDVCSTNAIKFGDINAKDSEFNKYREHKLGYYVLEELGIKPNVTYLARLRNIHSEDV